MILRQLFHRGSSRTFQSEIHLCTHTWKSYQLGNSFYRQCLCNYTLNWYIIFRNKASSLLPRSEVIHVIYYCLLSGLTLHDFCISSRSTISLVPPLLHLLSWLSRALSRVSQGRRKDATAGHHQVCFGSHQQISFISASARTLNHSLFLSVFIYVNTSQFTINIDAVFYKIFINIVPYIILYYCMNCAPFSNVLFN